MGRYFVFKNGTDTYSHYDIGNNVEFSVIVLFYFWITNQTQIQKGRLPGATQDKYGGEVVIACCLESINEWETKQN